MKKIIILFSLMLCITACSIDDNKVSNNITTTTTTTTKEEPIYVDDNPIKLGFYVYYGSNQNRSLISEYSTNWILNQDLCSLEVFYTNDNFIPGSNFSNLWNSYFSNYSLSNNYKIGYNIKFETTTGVIDKNILSPNDTIDIYNFMQIYLYDDVHVEPNVWYSHVTSEEYNDETLLTSIKLTGSTDTDKITSDIELTTFTYSKADDFYNNHYRGNSSYKVIIKRK